MNDNNQYSIDTLVDYKNNKTYIEVNSLISYLISSKKELENINEIRCINELIENLNTLNEKRNKNNQNKL